MRQCASSSIPATVILETTDSRSRFSDSPKQNKIIRVQESSDQVLGNNESRVAAVTEIFAHSHWRESCPDLCSCILHQGICTLIVNNDRTPGQAISTDDAGSSS